TIAILRLTEKRFGPFPSTPEGAPAPALGERSGAPSGLRPSSFVICNTPVEVQFTSAGCLNYPCRTPAEKSWRRLDGHDQLPKSYPRRSVRRRNRGYQTARSSRRLILSVTK